MVLVALFSCGIFFFLFPVFFKKALKETPKPHGGFENFKPVKKGKDIFSIKFRLLKNPWDV